ncbi:MAG: pantoate--beta-alanine ligase [Pyrinomonadaceae bacterium]
MEIINRRQRMASLARRIRREDKSIGFVPTMGALHEGHLSLIRKARQMCDVVVVSIFVNPEQFNDRADFEKYPRDLTADSTLLAGLNVDYIFAPSAEEIYPEGFATYVSVDEIADRLEGASRPGHFRGVATIVTILFNTVRPEFGFFGQKDAQQVAVIKKLARDLGFETEIVVHPIVREENGLAMSSRNERLSAEQREKASVIFESLNAAKTLFESGESNATRLAEIVRKTLDSEPAGVVDYVAVVDGDSLEPIESIGDRPALIAVAVKFGDIRLIDNIVLGGE